VSILLLTEVLLSWDLYLGPLLQYVMPVGIEAWITQIPPITRGWLALSVLISLAVVRVPHLNLFFEVGVH
jgi:hypothetical protein